VDQTFVVDKKYEKIPTSSSSRAIISLAKTVFRAGLIHELPHHACTTNVQSPAGMIEINGIV
jgi:hypothetical protein